MGVEDGKLKCDCEIGNRGVFLLFRLLLGVPSISLPCKFKGATYC